MSKWIYMYIHFSEQCCLVSGECIRLSAPDLGRCWLVGEDSPGKLWSLGGLESLPAVCMSDYHCAASTHTEERHLTRSSPVTASPPSLPSNPPTHLRPTCPHLSASINAPGLTGVAYLRSISKARFYLTWLNDLQSDRYFRIFYILFQVYLYCYVLRLAGP